jgi:AraC-like DNA-binding protein/ligand-binding sensor protein
MEHPIYPSSLKEKISGASIIDRREIEPLLLKAQEVLISYQQVVNCVIAVRDQTGRAVKIAPPKQGVFFCEVCRKHYSDPSRVWNTTEYPCNKMHTDSVAEAHRAGGTYIYTCELGFIFWISLIYSRGRQIGALSAGQVLCIEPQEAVKRICAITKGALSEGEALKYLDAIPARTHEEIKALVQMLGFCADQLAADIGDYTDGVKPAEQTPRGKAAKPVLRNGEPQKTPSPHYPLDKERFLLAALRRGDYETAKKMLRELLDCIVITNPGNFDFIQLRAIELVVILSREALNSEQEPETTEYRLTLEVNNRYLRKIQESKNIDELIETLYSIIECIGGRIFSFQGVRHASALRKAERYIWEHYTRKLSLQEIAEVSGLSASYFSSIFKEEMGENLSSYLNRLRVEKAAVMLTETDLSLNQISGACGFEDQSWFSKIFKSYVGVSPGKYREQGVVIEV